MKNKIFILFFAFSSLAVFDQCSNPYAQGQALYEGHCQSCHHADGSAFKQLMPPLAESDYLTNQKNNLPCIIKNGLEGEIVVNGKTYDSVMGSNEHLSDVEITNIINYINNSFGNENGYTSLEEVQSSLDDCEN